MLKLSICDTNKNKKIIWRKDESHTCNSNNNRWITQDEYDKKASELKQRQYELNDKLKRVIEADESYSITLITLLNICSRAPELFESSKVEQKRQLINFLLSNLKLRGKTLEFELKKPFDALVNLQNCKNRSEWLPQGVKFRTRF